MADFNIKTQTITSTTAVMKVVGALDSTNFDILEDGFNQVLESGVLGLVIDLSDLESIPSAGVGALVNLSTVLADRKGKLAVSLPPGDLRGLFDLLGIYESLTVVDTPEAARKLIASIR